MDTFTVFDEILDIVLQLVPQQLWSLMLKNDTSLEATLRGNLIQVIIISPFCFQLKEWKPWSYLREKSRKTSVSLFHSHLKALLHNVLFLHHYWAPLHSRSVYCFYPLVTILQWSGHRRSGCCIFLLFKVPCLRWPDERPYWRVCLPELIFISTWK